MLNAFLIDGSQRRSRSKGDLGDVSAFWDNTTAIGRREALKLEIEARSTQWLADRAIEAADLRSKREAGCGESTATSDAGHEAEDDEDSLVMIGHAKKQAPSPKQDASPRKAASPKKKGRKHSRLRRSIIQDSSDDESEVPQVTSRSRRSPSRTKMVDAQANAVLLPQDQEAPQSPRATGTTSAHSNSLALQEAGGLYLSSNRPVESKDRSAASVGNSSTGTGSSGREDTEEETSDTEKPQGPGARAHRRSSCHRHLDRTTRPGIRRQPSWG